MIALLGLSLTDCKGDDPDPIVGDWSAVQVDMEKYPMVGGEGPDDVRIGFNMHIEADLLGELEFYSVYSYSEEDISLRGEYGLGLSVEAEAAPTYRITVRGFAEDFIGEGGDVYYSDDGYSENGGYGETGYSETGYAETGSADTGYASSGVLGEVPQQDGDRGVRRSSAAGSTLVLSCTLAADALECSNADKSDPDSFQSLSFVRKTPESN